MTGDYKLMDHFFHTEEYDANMTSILYGMVSQAAQEVDVNLIADLTEELFKNVDGPPGSDLASRNIQVCSWWSFWDFTPKSMLQQIISMVGVDDDKLPYGQEIIGYSKLDLNLIST